jgi:tetratricopeptide (TPR) repeat protein
VNHKNGLAISYEDSAIFISSREISKRLYSSLNKELQLVKELYEANPHSESLKNGLAISTKRLGDIYQQQGDFKKALQFFDQRAIGKIV